MGVQFHEYTKNHLIVFFRRMNLMVCELQLNKAITKNEVV